MTYLLASLPQALIHKDSVYLMDTRAVDGRAPPALDKVALPDPLSPVTQVRGMLIVWDSAAVVLLFHAAVPLLTACGCIAHAPSTTNDYSHFCRRHGPW
jgi:hypothetical protein